MGMNMRKKSTEGEVKCVIVGDGGVGKTSLLMSYTSGGIMMDYIPTCFDCYTVDMAAKDRSYTMSLIDTAGQETYDRLRTLSYHSTDVFVVCFSLADQDSLENVKSKWVPEIKRYRPNTPFIIVGTQSDLRQGKQSTCEAVTTDSFPSADDTQSVQSTPQAAVSDSKDGIAMTSTKVVPNNPWDYSSDPNEFHCYCTEHQQTIPKQCISTSKGKSLAKKLGAEGYLECSALRGDGVADVFTSALRTAIRPRKIKSSIFKHLVSIFRTNKRKSIIRDT